jgi:formamidopyrimidine-DNA glycosylase
VPELPEVETERGRLAGAVTGRRILSARIDDPRLTRPEDPVAVAAALTGDRVDAVERRGKYIVVRLASRNTLLVHLRMTGGFRYEPATHERAVLELEGGGRVAYRDTRRFGTWLLTDTGDAYRIIAAKNGP